MARASIFLLLCFAASAQTIRIPWHPPKNETNQQQPEQPPPPEEGKDKKSPTPIPRTRGCVVLPMRGDCAPRPDEAEPPTEEEKAKYINTFYGTADKLSWLNQIKSVYNGASGSATVSADVATLNFSNGMEWDMLTNVQAGSQGTTSPTSGNLPSLASSGAAQAAQNTLYGGTFVIAATYPLLAYGATQVENPGNLGVLISLVSRGGTDIQNFNAGTSVDLSSPPFHASSQIQGYLQYNSVNLVPNSSMFAGALFVGGSYGYNYMAHDYARAYGFGDLKLDGSLHPIVSSGLGQVSFGVFLNGVVKVAVSRGFGPAQTYVDSTTKLTTKKDNFSSWSVGITYQPSRPR